MNAKEYLEQAFWLDKLIDSKLNRAAALREKATRTTSIMSDAVVSHTRNVHGMEDAIVQIVGLEREMDADVDSLVSLKKEIGSVINQVPDMACRVVLEYRYLEGRQWSDISKDLKMHPRSVFRIHERALQEVTKILHENAS